MNKILLTTLLAMVTFMVNAQFSSNADIDDHNRVTINKYPINGYLEHLPPDYNSNPTKKYPVIVFLHGQGEMGNGTSDLWKAARQGPPFEAERNKKLCIDGECFIVLTPQLVTGSWSAAVQAPFWDYILNQRGLRIDMDRIYLTGLSLGGNGAWNWVSSTYPDSEKVAAVAVMAGWGSTSQAYRVNQKGISTSGFHGTSDPVISYNSGKAMSDAVKNSSNPYNAEHRWHAFSGGAHNIWWNVYRMDELHVSPNVYRWMASKRRQNGSSSTPVSEPNQAPTVNAGSDITVGIASGNASITASANDSDGSIVSYSWTKISGPAVSMWNTGAATMNLSNFAASGGTYEFQVTVRDNDGATATDRVRVTKQVALATAPPPPSSTNVAPTVSAGADITVPVSSGSASIQANASDSDGSIQSYSWTKISGPSVDMWSTGSSKLILSNFAASGGVYEFRITVTDDDGAQGSDVVRLTKEVAGGSTGGGSTGNAAPTVTAGPDITVDISSGSAAIQSVASDSDGSIVSYEWTKVSGPSVDMWSTGSSKMILSNFASTGGTYDFKVTVTDDDGATASDIVRVVKEVTATSTPSGTPTVSAGPDLTIDLYTGSATIYGTASDSDGSIVSYEWTKVSGPSVSMWSTGSRNMIVSNFAATGGIYEFRLTVTDNAGNKASDVMRLTKHSTLTSSANTSNNITLSVNNQDGEFTQLENIAEIKNYRTDGTPLQMSTGGEHRVIIMSISGVMVADEKISGSLNPAILSNGMYIYHMVTNDGRLVQKGRIIRY
jgi:poly(3-hydroxybutyrate) depolymerase